MNILQAIYEAKAAVVGHELGKVAAALAAILVPFLSNASAQTTEHFLREWATKNIYFNSGQDGARVLFARSKPVRVDLRIDVPSIAAEARTAIASFSDAFGLQHDYVADRANLFVAIGDEVNIGDKPNPAFLARAGVPQDAASVIVETQKWASGCGFYSFADRAGRISGSVVAGDKRLPPERLQDCIVSGIAFSFGVRALSGSTFDTSKGYIQYLLLANSMAHCDREIRETQQIDVENVYLSCITDQLKTKLTAR